MKIKSYFQISRNKPRFLALRRTLSLVRYVEATIFSFLPLTWQVQIAYFPTSLKVLIFVYPDKQSHKLTNPRMDRQSDYSTPCAQAHGVTNRQTDKSTDRQNDYSTPCCARAHGVTNIDNLIIICDMLL